MNDNLLINKVTANDVEAVNQIFNDAKTFLKSQNIDQWQDSNGYPNSRDVAADITGGEGYVIKLNDKAMAYFALSFAGESTYQVIDGQWLNNNSYAVIHRLAISNDYRGQGIAGQIFKKIEKICLANNCSNIRIDTHKDNKIMQAVLAKAGYKYCGVITLQSRAKRLAYQKILGDI
ncbi:MAG: GNAT family N-acetyltransferase [Spirochaetaceae bacterium]|nr:GNAT family N-acetyltransferase [Spirochaetaceae bacterium]